MEFRELLSRTRSYRRFKPGVDIGVALLRDLVSLTRFAPSGGNYQPLKFIISNDRETNRAIFATLGWARQLAGWDGPTEDEAPSAYIVILIDKKIPHAMGLDGGIAAHTILLGAAEAGYQGCMLANIDRKALREKLDVPADCDIHLVCAMGRGAEEVDIEDHAEGGGIIYYRDKNDRHHVPKRTLGELIVAEYTAESKEQNDGPRAG